MEDTKELVKINTFNTILQNVIEDTELLNIRIFSFKKNIKNNFCKKPLFMFNDIYKICTNDKNIKHMKRFIKNNNFTDKEIIKEKINIKGKYWNERDQKVWLLTIYGLIKFSGLCKNKISIVLREYVYTLIDYISNKSIEGIKTEVVEPTILTLKSQVIVQEIAELNIEKPAVVYFINQVGSNKCKIGYTTDLGTRLETLQTGNPQELKVIRSIECESIDEAQKKEIYYHNLYNDAHITGEWFLISELK